MDRPEPSSRHAARPPRPPDGSDRSAADDPAGPGYFPQTLWTLVNEANYATEHSAHSARSQLCEMYWYPLYAYVRRSGCSPHDAEDVTQGFFSEFLASDFLAGTSAERGRLRAYLKTCIKHYLSKWRRQARAQKRGGGQPHFSIDQASAEERYGLEPPDALTPEVLYDRHWALMLMKHAHDRLEQEYRQQGKARFFEALKGTLARDSAGPTFADLAPHLDRTPENLRVMASRMRKRYKDILEDEIAATVNSPKEIAEELNFLLSVFSD